jgi:arylsulfatase A-like enzyme
MAPSIKNFVKKLAGSLLMVMLLAGTSLTLQAQKKNILFIAIDDLKPTIKAYGDDYAITPVMDKLASEGYVFQNAYTQQAVCGPSRASMLTGWRPDRTKVWDLKTLIRDINPDVVPLPEYFKQNGYTVIATGKIYDPRSVDKQYDGVSWSEPYKPPYKLNTYYENKPPKLGYYQSPEYLALYKRVSDSLLKTGMKHGRIDGYMRKHYKPSTEKADVPDNAYEDGAIALDAIKKLDKLSKGDKPFLLMVGFKRPHLPFAAPSKYWNLYKEEEIPLAKWQKHSIGGPNVAYHTNGELRSYTDIPAYVVDKQGHIDRSIQPRLIHGYYAATSYVDTQIGKVIKALEEKGLKDNTIIVLWGDHGWHLGDHGLWCKHTNFEQATRLPLLIIDPTKKPGETTIPVETLDIFPTLCELAGIEPEPTLQGKSLVPLLEGKDISQKYAISQWPVLRKHNGMGYTIRTERYRYTEWYKDYRSTEKRDPSKLVATELYDYVKDPQETKNLVYDKEYKKVLKEHEKLLHKFLDSQVGTDNPNK